MVRQGGTWKQQGKEECGQIWVGEPRRDVITRGDEERGEETMENNYNRGQHTTICQRDLGRQDARQGRVPRLSRDVNNLLGHSESEVGTSIRNAGGYEWQQDDAGRSKRGCEWSGRTRRDVGTITLKKGVTITQ